MSSTPTDKRELDGVYVPLVTPYAVDGSVDIGALQRLAERCLDSGASGLAVLTTTGEHPLLDADERRRITQACATVCEARGSALIVGAGTNSTAQSVEEVRALADVPGVTAALCLVPYYVRPSQAGIVAHFEAIAASSPVPIIIYNIPYRTGRLLEAEGMLRLAGTPNIVGVKQAVGGIDTGTERILAEAPPNFSMLGGDDAYLFPLALLGAKGAIAASANVCTPQVVQMVEAARAGDHDMGRELHAGLLPVVEACFAEPNPVVFKAVLHAQGLIPTPDVRLPLVNASPDGVRRAIEAIRALEARFTA